jgi:hypothetical protein
LSTGESIYIEPYVVHGFEGFAGERAVVRERADPAGDYKAAYESLNLKSSYRMS